MAKKRRKVYRKTKTGWKELSPYLKRKAERERQEREPLRIGLASAAAARLAKQKPKKPKPIRVREHELRPMIREAARAGLVEAIEHTSNFWNVSDGYKKYIEQQIALQSEALMAAVRTVISEELSPFRRIIARARRRKR